LGIKSTVTDSAGNTSAFSGEMVVKLDQTPPGQTDKPDLVDASDTGNLNDDDYTSDLTPEFSIADVISGDSVFVIISDGSESDTTGKDFATNDTIQITLSNLTSDNISADDGVFSFTAFAVDSAGNASATVSSALSVTIDTTAPSAPIITLRSEDDSGVLNDDQLTNVMNPQFNAWNADGEDSLYIAAGSDTVFRGVPDENPDVVSTDSTTEGTISYTALLRDKAGNLSSVSTAYPVVIDTTRPGTPSLPDLLSASDAGFDDEDNITNETLPSFILTGLSGTIDSALIYFDGSVVGSQWISQPSTDTLQIDQQSFNSVEIFGVSVGAIDSAGNVSLISDTLTIKIDTELPTTSDPDLIPASDLGESSSDDITSDNTPTILLSSLEPGSINKLYRIAPGPPADTVMVQVDTVAAGEDTLSLTPSSPLTDDTYTVYSTTEDTAGNVVESGDLINLVIDTQEPSAVISLEDYLVRLEDLSDTVRVHFSEGMSDPPRISVRFAGGSVQDTSDMSSEFDSVWFFLLDIPDSNDGAATISITATDNASNELDSLNIVGRTLLKIDNTDPVFSSITPDTGAFVNYTEVAYTISEHANNPTRLDSASFIWTPTGPGSVIQADLETFELDVGAHALGTLTNDPQLEDGELYTLSITSQDSAGNEGTTIVGNVTYDTTSPSAFLTYSSYLTRADSTVTITATFSEQSGGIPSLLIEYNSGAGDSDSGNMTDQSGDSTVWSYDVLIPSGVVNNDTALVTITTTDRALNSLTTDSTFFRDTLLVDNSTASVLSVITSDSLVKELDVDTVTVVFDEPMQPFPMLEVLWAGGDTLESSQMTEVNGTDSTEWIFVISSVPDSNDGFATVVINAFDDAGNPITSSSSDIIEVDNVHPTFTDVSPDSNTFVNHKNIAYTLSEELESGTVTWQRTSGVMDPVTHVDTLEGSELLPGVHESFEPFNAPDLTDGSVYRVTYDGFDFALNTAVQTISGSVMYDTTSPSAFLTYSSYLTRADSTVTITATFSEQSGGIPSLLIEYNSGAGDSDSGNMTDQSGDSTVWSYDVLIPSGVVNNDTALVTITTTDRALNSLTTDSTFFRDTLLVDNSTASVLSVITSDSLVKELDVDTVTVVFDEPMQPFPMLEVLWAGGDTLESSQMTEVNGTDSTEWIFVISSVPDSNDGFATVVINAFDDAGNPITSSSSDIIEVDNVHPTFTDVSPDSNTFVNHKNIAYTLSEELESGTVTWQRTSGVMDPVTHVDTLEGSELLPGVHESFEPFNAPDLTDGSVYRVTYDGFDFALNTAVQTISGSVMYDTTSPSAFLTYSSYLTRADSTVTITATFSEQSGGIPSLLIEYNSGAGDSDSGNMTDQSGDSTVWSYDVLIPSGVVNNDTALVTITTTDRALNSLTTDSTFFRDTLLVDNSTASVLSVITSDSLVKELDVDTVTVVFDEPMQPFPMLEVLWAGGDTLESSQMTEVNGTDSTEWIFVISSVPDSNDGFATVVINAFDDAGNPITSSSSDIIEVDNVHPTFTDVSPDSNTFVNHKNIAYTLSEELESGTVTWQRTSGVMDPVTHVDTLEGSELLPGVHESFEPFNAPDLTDGSVYRVTYDGFDFALNTAVQTISGSVMYDTTGPTVDSLVYSKNPAMPGDTVEVKAYFNEIVPITPYFITIWPGLGGEDQFVFDSTLNGEMLVWLTEVEVPDILSLSGNVKVTPIAQDRATNTIDSLGGLSVLFDTTWYIDVDAPTCSLTYANIDQSTLTNLGKGGDEVQITARFNEQTKGFSDAVPRLTIIFTDTSDHSIEETPFTASSNGDTTWTYSFDLPSDSSHTGFMTVRLAAYDLAGNLVEDVVDTNVFEIDNIPPSLFTTGAVTPMGTLPKDGWFNQRTDSVAVLVPIDSEDPSLFQGKLQIRMQIDGVPASETDVGMPVTLTNISQDNTVDLMRDTVSTAFDPADFVEGVSLISWAELYDLAGNVTEGSSSTDTLVVDTIPPVMDHGLAALL
jgi:heptaprenylglyceryl phosphate synthase/uncharacterized protein YkvS